LHTPTPTQERRFGRALLVASALFIAVLTLTPAREIDALPPFLCLTCGLRPVIDFLLNIFLFVPLGAAFCLMGWRRRRALLVALICTGAIEFLQWLILPGRYPSLRDVLTNAFGALVGYQLAMNWRVLLVPRPGAARVLLTAAALVWVGIQTFGGWALQLDAPPTPWWLQLRPRHDRFPANFTGRVLNTDIGARSFRYSDQIENADLVRADWLERPEFRTQVDSTSPTRGLAPIIIISAGPIKDAALIGQISDDAACQIRMRGSNVGLQAPTIRLRDGVRAERGDTVAIGCRYVDAVLTLTSASGSNDAQRNVRASASWTWAWFVPLGNYAFRSELFVGTAIWLVLMWIVIGYWARLGIQGIGSRLFVAAVLGLAMVAGLAVVQAIFGLRIASKYEWVSAFLGAIGGLLLGGELMGKADGGWRFGDGGG
jgi:VanZ family protein